jgi:antitoxin (DNA-binding transcriptional repressor) of toxin-antitoxin stability system
MKVSAQYAEEHFQEILATAARGEEVEIASEGSPSFKLLVMPQPQKRKGPIVLGAGRGEIVMPTDEEWRAMKEEDARLMNDAPLMTSGEI